MSVDSVPTKYILISRPALIITLPGKWEQTRHDGPDFEIHWLVSDALGGSLGIYVGHHPQGVHPTATSTMTTKSVGELPVKFCITPVQDGQKGAAIVEGFFKGYPSSVDWMRLHIMINATKPEFLDVVWQGLKTLRNIDTIPNQFTMKSWGNGAPSLSIWLPGKWKQTCDDGPDFNVHGFASDVLGVSLSLYVGHHPQPVPNLPTTTKVTKQVGALPVEFSITPGEHGQKYEAIINDFFKGCPGSGVDALQLHIILTTTKPELLLLVWNWLQNLKKQE